MKKWLKINSLQKRYAILTVALVIIMLLANWMAWRQANQLESQIQENLASRLSLLQHDREIRNNIWSLRDYLSKVQVNPRKFYHPDYISNTIGTIHQHIQRINEHPWIQQNYASTTRELSQTLKVFKDSAEKMVDIQRHPQQLYPSVSISNFIMQPTYADVINQLNLAIDSLEEEKTENYYEEYLVLVRLRYNWMSLTTNFRMYMLNRLNAFQEKYLVNQVDLISTLHEAIVKQMRWLNKQDKAGKLSFNTSFALENLNKDIKLWFRGFKQVRKIHESNEWRRDILVYEAELAPQLEKITALLRILDASIEKFSHKDLNDLSSYTQLQLQLIWMASLVGLFILIAGYIFLSRKILRPIADVTHALREESRGVETELHSNIRLLETRNLVAAFRELRKQIHNRQKELEYHALHDDLTGLANRSLLIDRLNQAIHNAKQDNNSFAILIMDLDHFKEVNDTLGHEVGDKLLQQVAKRLHHILREVDVVARLGGDEFSVLLNTAQEQQAKHIAHKITTEFHNVFTVDDIPLYIGISIGISVYPQHGLTSQILQQRADIAMYIAKRNKTGYEVYNPKYDEHSIGKLSLISGLRYAIEENQLFMQYQPIINLKNNELVAAEALLRWNHPQHGQVMPDEIIPIAEQTGMINPITYWIIDTTSQYCKHLKQLDVDIKVAINLSIYNLQDSKFIENVKEIINRNNIMGSKFIMEVTESVMMTNPRKVIKVLSQLDEMGIEIAVDDFGTGYSSLSYLKQLPISRLKIDKSFIMDMKNNDNDAIIVRSTIDLAHNLGMQVVGEGIEDLDSQQLLDMLGCEYGQGYYISKPLSQDDFEQWLKTKELLRVTDNG